MTRNEFLTELMGKHYSPLVEEFIKDFPWEWFGMVWEFSRKQDWWLVFLQDVNIFHISDYINLNYVDPNKFADAVAKFHGWKE